MNLIFYLNNKSRAALHISMLLLWVLVLTPNLLHAQAKYTISGTVKDKSTGELLIGAVVRLENDKSVGTVTNDYGFYSLTLKEGDYTVLVNYVGYKEIKLKTALKQNVRQNVQLEAQNTELEDITVKATKSNENVTSSQMGVERLNVKEINMVPVLFGERDIMKTLQLLPGIKSAGEGGSGFYVRGGKTDQNLILLDEALVYNPSHLMGFFSTFNSDAVKDVTVYKGNMPAQYGGRLASVMDVKMNDGNDKSYHVNGGIGLIASRLSVEGPIVKEKGSFLVSGRRTYADMFLKLSADTAQRKAQLYFYDLNLKASYNLSEKDRLYVSGYFGRDRFGYQGLFGLDWGNATGTVRWNRIINDKLFSNTSLIYSDYNYKISISMDNFDASIYSQIKDWTLKEEINYLPNPNNNIKIGIHSIYHTIKPGEYRGSIITQSIPYNYSWENALYVNNSWKASQRLNVDYGIRLSAYSVLGGDNNFYTLNEEHEVIDTFKYSKGSFAKTYFMPEPRVSASYRLNETSSVKAAYSRNAQYLHLISNSTTTTPVDKWVGTNNNIKPEFADQVSAGYFRNFKDNMFELSGEIYYKYMQNQIDYKDNANTYTNGAIETELLYGHGRAYGLELSLKKKVGDLTGWISYTLSRTEKQIKGINNDQWYAARQDRTHDIAIVGIYQLSKKVNVSATWVYYTGDAVSFPSGKYMVDNQVVFLYTERNGYRMPAYHRLDLGSTIKLSKPAKKFQSELALSVYNAYGRQNPYVIQFEQSKTDPDKTVAVQTALFRWVPSITYNFKF